MAPFLCVVPLSIVSEALHPPLWLQVTTARAYRGYCYVTVAEADVRVRIRGRVVSVHRQRGQVRVVSVVAAPETTDTRQCSRLISTSPPDGYSDSLVRFGRWPGFLLQRCRTASPHYAVDSPSGVYPTKNRGHPTIGMTSVSDFPAADRLAAVFAPLLSVWAALSRGYSFSVLATLGRFTFSFWVGSLASLVTGVCVSEFCNRCRSRRT